MKSKLSKIPVNNKTICILANTKVGDLYGDKILKTLKNDFKINDIKVIGNGGDYLKQHGQNSLIDLNDLREKFLHLWRYSTKHYNNMKYSSIHLYQVLLRMNNNILGQMNEQNVFDNIARARPSCIINLDNEHLSQEMSKKLNGKLFLL